MVRALCADASDKESVMGYRGSDDRYGGNDRDRYRESRGYREGPGYGQRDPRERGRQDHSGGEDRNFLERAGEQVRSWFSDDDDDHDQHHRGRGDPREARSGHRNPSPGDLGGGGFGGGWGNQQGESWNRDRPGERGWFTDSVGGERGHRRGGADGRHEEQRPLDRDRGYEPSGAGAQRGADLHDPHYAEWRRRQIDELDRDYEEYRREHHARFEQEFGAWRAKRHGQRQQMGKVAEHMEVTGSDGQHVGTVDKVVGDRIILTRTDANAGGMHHSIPCSWVESVEDKVTINKSAEEAMKAWREEEQQRALYENRSQGSGGPHILNRSFSGTY
jgi:hypothetical protein